MRKNTDQKYSEYEHFSRSVYNKKKALRKWFELFIYFSFDTKLVEQKTYERFLSYHK